MPILVYFSKFYLHIVNYLIKIYFIRHFVAQAEKSRGRAQPSRSISPYPFQKENVFLYNFFAPSYCFFYVFVV